MLQSAFKVLEPNVGRLGAGAIKLRFRKLTALQKAKGGWSRELRLNRDDCSLMTPAVLVAAMLHANPRNLQGGRDLRHEVLIPRINPVERAKGIEPSYAAWEAAVLPLNYAR